MAVHGSPLGEHTNEVITSIRNFPGAIRTSSVSRAADPAWPHPYNSPCGEHEANAACPSTNFTQRTRLAMTTIELRTEIMRLLREEENTSILEAIRLLLCREEAEEETYTEEDIAELDQRREERLRGDVPAHGVEESLRLAREGYKG